nr:MAG TPA: hypothetical protein [Caudoviricetes sp.]
MDFKKTYFDIWKAAWDFHKNYCNPYENSEYWDKVVDEAYKINAMYENSSENKFVNDLVLAILAELERKNVKK